MISPMHRRTDCISVPQHQHPCLKKFKQRDWALWARLDDVLIFATAWKEVVTRDRPQRPREGDRGVELCMQDHAVFKNHIGYECPGLYKSDGERGGGGYGSGGLEI